MERYIHNTGNVARGAEMTAAAQQAQLHERICETCGDADDLQAIHQVMERVKWAERLLRCQAMTSVVLYVVWLRRERCP